MTISELEPDRVLLAGDWHGSLAQAKAVVRRAHEEMIRVVLQLGDFGIWPRDSAFLNGLNELLEELDMLVFFVDGNHEDFDQLYEYPLQEDGTRLVRSRIFHLPRGLRWEWYGVRFAALGGAHSVDRDMRTEGQSWWPQEWVNDEELELFRAGGPADVVLMHDSPWGAPNVITDSPLSQHNAMRYFGKHNIDLATEHRRRLATAIDPTDPAQIFHGHYHEKMFDAYLRDGGRTCTVVGLTEGGHGPWASTLIYDVLNNAAGLISTRGEEHE